MQQPCPQMVWQKKECLKKKYCKNEFVSVKSCALPPQFWGRIRVNLSDRRCVFAYGLQVNIYMHTSVLTLGFSVLVWVSMFCCECFTSLFCSLVIRFCKFFFVLSLDFFFICFFFYFSKIYITKHSNYVNTTFTFFLILRLRFC